MATDAVEDVEMREAQREYLDFLDDEQDQGVYHGRVREMIQENRFRLVVDVNDLRRRNEARAARLLTRGFEELLAFQRALKDLVASVDATYAKQHQDFLIGLEGSFGHAHVTPRTLTSRLLGGVVCLEGLVTKCSLVRPKVVRSVHYCPATKKTLERKYTDMTSLDAFPSSAIYPTKDEENNPLETEFGLCEYQDHQTVMVQELPEGAPAGQLPRSVDLILGRDLVDEAKPGDRVQVVGVYRCLPAKKGGYTSGTFRTVLVACRVKQMSKQVNLTFSADDINKIKNFSKARSADVFDVLSRSLAPSIHGHPFIKRALLCLLLGGAERLLPNGSRIRGDINLLLIGDPSVAKSQLLRYVLLTAPRAVAATGRGSSGVGLTAAVTTDQETGERRLEAGAMVLGDRGVVCIDEFDKMSDADRTAIHEVMEQGRVTIAKAGVHARLNARCSVLAAANPVYGRYDQYKSPMENIGLQDSLLSRFDLVFILLDTADPQHDRRVAEHVLRMHQYRPPNQEEGAAMAMGGQVEVLATADPEEEEEEEMQVYEKHNNLLHGTRRRERIVSKEFIRKYIHVAKAVSPALTQEAANHIAEEYARLRSQEQMGADIARTSPVTPRTLETLLRLSVAHARARLSKAVELQDAAAALELVSFCYFKKVLEKDKKRHRKQEDSEEEEEEEEATQQQRKKRGRGSQAEATSDPYDFAEEQEAPEIKVATPKPSQLEEPEEAAAPQGEEPTLSSDRLKQFKACLLEAFRSAHAQSIGMTSLMTRINQDQEGQSGFSAAEARAALASMQDDNQVMVADDIIFLI